MDLRSTISEYEQLCKWTNILHQLSDEDWHGPIKEGKVSIAGIIAHLRNWDLHLMNVVIPSIREGKGMEFPDFNSFNSKAYQYANSGISKDQLLQEFSSDRMKLIDTLKSMKSEELRLEVSANGLSNCPKTGTPYSLLYIIQEFTEHDDHHKKQIMSVLD